MDRNELSIRRFVRAALEESPLEGRAIRTLITLFRRPGKLTAEYIAGRRLPYVRPFRVYLLISLLFFFIVPYTGLFRYDLEQYRTLPVVGDAPSRMVDAELVRTRESREAYTVRFNEELAKQKKTMMIFLVPMFALGMVPLFRRRRFGEHLVFATHYFAALLLFLGVFIQIFFRILLSALRAGSSVLPEFSQSAGRIIETEEILLVCIFVPAFLYLWSAARRAYGVSGRHAALAALALVFWQFILLVYFYRAPLFYTTFYSLKIFS